MQSGDEKPTCRVSWEKYSILILAVAILVLATGRIFSSTNAGGWQRAFAARNSGSGLRKRSRARSPTTVLPMVFKLRDPDPAIREAARNVLLHSWGMLSEDERAAAAEGLFSIELLDVQFADDGSVEARLRYSSKLPSPCLLHVLLYDNGSVGCSLATTTILPMGAARLSVKCDFKWRRPEINVGDRLKLSGRAEPVVGVRIPGAALNVEDYRRQGEISLRWSSPERIVATAPSTKDPHAGKLK